MSNEITITVVGTAAPAIVEKEALRAFYSAQVVAKPGVVMYKSLVGKPGQYYDFHVFSTLTIAGIAASGVANTNTSITHTQARVTMNLWQGTNIRVPNVSALQSVFDYEKEFGVAAGAALAEDMDLQLLNDFASFTSNIVGSTTTPDAFQDSMIRGAIAKLDTNKVPQEARSLVLHPLAHMQLLADSDFKAASRTGESKGVHVSGLVLPVYGITLLKSAIVQTNGSAYANVLFNEQAWGVVVNQEIKIAKHDQLGDFSVAYLGSYLMGEAVTRQIAGCVINSTIAA